MYQTTTRGMEAGESYEMGDPACWVPHVLPTHLPSAVEIVNRDYARTNGKGKGNEGEGRAAALVLFLGAALKEEHRSHFAPYQS